MIFQKFLSEEIKHAIDCIKRKNDFQYFENFIRDIRNQLTNTKYGIYESAELFGRYSKDLAFTINNAISEYKYNAKNFEDFFNFAIGMEAENFLYKHEAELRYILEQSPNLTKDQKIKEIKELFN